MAGNIGADKDKQPSFRIPRRGVVGWLTMGPIIIWICSKLGFRLSYANLTGQETADGLHLDGGDNGGDNGDPWWAEGETDGEGRAKVHVRGGEYNGLFIPDTDLFLRGSGKEYVCLFPIHKLHIDHSFVYTYDEAVDDTIIIDLNDAGSRLDSPDGKTFALALALFEDGVKVSQGMKTNIIARLEDNSGGGTVQARILFAAAP